MLGIDSPPLQYRYIWCNMQDWLSSPACDMYHGMEHSFTLTRWLRVLPNSTGGISPQFFPICPKSRASFQSGDQTKPQYRPHCRFTWEYSDEIRTKRQAETRSLRVLQADIEEGVGSWLLPPSWSGGLCAGGYIGGGGGRGRWRLSPTSSSLVTSDIEGSLELMKRRKNKVRQKSCNFILQSCFRSNTHWW